MIKRGDKKAQGLSTNAIVLIVLGVVVLAVLIIGFTIGWSKIFPWISSDNSDAIIQACTLACSTKNVDGFCSIQRDLKGTSLPDGKYTCEELVRTGFGVEACPDISCPKPIEGRSYSWVTSLNECDITKNQKVVTASYCSKITKVNGKNICCEQS